MKDLNKLSIDELFDLLHQGKLDVIPLISKKLEYQKKVLKLKLKVVNISSYIYKSCIFTFCVLFFMPPQIINFYIGLFVGIFTMVNYISVKLFIKYYGTKK